MKEIPEQWESYFEAYRNSKYYMERMLNDLQLTLSARLTEETYRDILNFERATIEDTPIVEMEKALVSKEIKFSKANYPKTTYFNFDLFRRNICTMVCRRRNVP